MKFCRTLLLEGGVVGCVGGWWMVHTMAGEGIFVRGGLACGWVGVLRSRGGGMFRACVWVSVWVGVWRN